jgi:short-subunit dehydrogenase
VHSGFAERASLSMSTAADPHRVAAATLRALERSRGRVRPGTSARVLGGSLTLLPRRLRVRVVGRIMAGMTVPVRVDRP